jgi:hypothetical protein
MGIYFLSVDAYRARMAVPEQAELPPGNFSGNIPLNTATDVNYLRIT